jgi:uncharacterized protein
MVSAVGSTIWIERRKWPDHPHYGAQGVVLGEDEHGIWAGCQPGSQWTRRDEPAVLGTVSCVWCIPRDGWFLAHFIRGEGDLDIYIDVAAPGVWSPRGVKLVDLDFDVIVWRDRPVELVDEDEFEQHRVELGYPDDVIASARQEAARILEAATAGCAPFSLPLAATWMQVLDERHPAG